MSFDLVVLFAVVIALGANTVLMSLPVARTSDTYFWAVNVFNGVVGASVIGFGMPGFDHLPPPAGTLVSLMLGGMFFYHIAQFFNLRTRWQRVARQAAREARRAERTLRDDAPPPA